MEGIQLCRRVDMTCVERWICEDRAWPISSIPSFNSPRLRDFNGIVLPPKSTTPSTVSGVVSFGLPSEAMVSSSQLEVNVDAYPMLPGIRDECEGEGGSG